MEDLRTFAHDQTARSDRGSLSAGTHTHIRSYKYMELGQLNSYKCINDHQCMDESSSGSSATDYIGLIDAMVDAMDAWSFGAHLPSNRIFTGVGKCPILGILDIT